MLRGLSRRPREILWSQLPALPQPSQLVTWVSSQGNLGSSHSCVEEKGTLGSRILRVEVGGWGMDEGLCNCPVGQCSFMGPLNILLDHENEK